jgi:hypothetical protein
MQRISWPAERLLASQDCLSFLRLVKTGSCEHGKEPSGSTKAVNFSISWATWPRSAACVWRHAFRAEGRRAPCGLSQSRWAVPGGRVTVSMSEITARVFEAYRSTLRWRMLPPPGGAHVAPVMTTSRRMNWTPVFNPRLQMVAGGGSWCLLPSWSTLSVSGSEWNIADIFMSISVLDSRLLGCDTV